MIPNQTKEELAQIANDIFKGYIFTDRHVHNQNDIGMVFMPLLFMGKKEDEDEGVETELNDWGMVYEYVSKAGPRSCNGMPMFMSFHIPNIHDTKIVWEMYKKIEETEKKMMDDLKKDG